MSDLTLYEIQQEYLDLAYQIEQEIAEEGELSKETEDALVINQTQLTEKVDGYRSILATWDSNVLMGEKELEKVQAYINRKKAAIERLKRNLLQALLTYGDEDAKGVRSLEIGTTKLSTRRSKFVEIADEGQIDDEYIDVTVKMNKAKWDEMTASMSSIDLPPMSVAEKVSKVDIKRALGNGEDVDGAYMDERVHLTIK
jgi:hypothetical protein